MFNLQNYIWLLSAKVVCEQHALIHTHTTLQRKQMVFSLFCTSSLQMTISQLNIKINTLLDLTELQGHILVCICVSINNEQFVNMF